MSAIVHARHQRAGHPSRVEDAEIQARELARELRARTTAEVRFGSGSRALYATDASNFRQVPIGVVVPKSIDDVLATVEVCASHGAPIVPRGAGTSLSGETVNVAVVIDFSKYLHQRIEIDPDRRQARVSPGVILDDVRARAAEHGLTFGPDPATHSHCTIGGMLGNNSCGVHSVMAAKAGTGARTSDNVHALRVVTYDGEILEVGATGAGELDAVVRGGGRRGEIYSALRDLRDRHADAIRARFPDIPRRVSGYNLDELLPEKGFQVARALVGTEGTCVTVLEATLALIPNPKARSVVAVGYRTIFQAGDHVPLVMSHAPVGCEGMDRRLILDQRHLGMHARALALLPGADNHGWLLVEFGGDTKAEADDHARALMDALRDEEVAPEDMKLFDDPDDEEMIWHVREAGLAATAFPPDEGAHWPGWEDSAVPPGRIGPYLRDLDRLFEKYDYRAALYGHLGQGCVHCRISFDLVTAHGLAAYRSFMEEAADLVVSYGGSLSGEHGDGQQRAELLERMYGPELVDAFREFKRIWDPAGRMNPGKVVDPHRFDEDLKLGADYAPAHPKTHFAYPRDHRDFAHATLRCVGVGKCRVEGGQVMCPSYMVTREEQYTTRGRARLLNEMLRGEVITDGWRSDEVKDALDLCLACKGCTSECPVHVDMPTYKAEFLSHYYAGRLRPRHAYAFGLIDQAARIASRAPRAVNFAARTPGLSWAAKQAAGMAPRRSIPAFARQSLREWFAVRPIVNPDGPRMILWPDTFNNYFHVPVGIAAVEALEDAGYRVTMPHGHLCCGRPLYDYGFLDRAHRYLTRIVAQLRDDIRAGVPVIGIEPSCTAVFKDELVKLLPDDEDAHRLSSQVYHFSDFFTKVATHYEPPRLAARALVHGHCHHKATGGIDGELELLRRMGLHVDAPEDGCCGMAGSFGFEAGHYDVSMACGERVLLPAVRRESAETLIVADGFSCKTQIEQGGTGRRALHVAEVMQLAREDRHPSPDDAGAASNGRVPLLAAAGGVVAALGTAIVVRERRRR